MLVYQGVSNVISSLLPGRWGYHLGITGEIRRSHGSILAIVNLRVHDLFEYVGGPDREAEVV